MPFNKIHVPDSLSTSVCRLINDELHSSLVETCGVNPDDSFSLIARYESEDMIFHPTFLGERDPASTIVVEITLLEGRSDDQKEALYRDLRKRFAGLGLDPKNSIVFLNENRPVDWSFSPVGSVKTALDQDRP